MRNRKPDFESLEDWADRKLKQLGSPSVPKDFLAGVMHKVHAEPVAYLAAEKPAALLIWLRYGVVMASSFLLVAVMLFDASWVSQWWDQSWLADAYAVGSRLFLGGRQVAESIFATVPAYVWTGLCVCVLTAYAVVALTGICLLHFTFNRTRIRAV